MSSERTEAPTPKRLQDARDRGEVSKSEEVVSIGVLLVAVIGMRLVGPPLWNGMADMLREGLMNPPAEELTRSSAIGMGKDGATRSILALMPLFTMLALAGIALNVGQSGLILSGAKLKPKLSHINPGAGVKRIISTDGLMNLGKALTKMSVISLVVWMTMRSRMAEIASLGNLGVGPATANLAGLAFDIALRAAIVLFGMALADYAWQRRQWVRKLRMSKEELKQEMRESDGDPQVKAAIRRHRQSLMNRMMSAVPNADVVVTNPTHFAVALKYDPVTMGAPIVIAKGHHLIQKINGHTTAKAGIPVLEEPPLARALYAAVPVGQHIPANLFHAVAEVLAWVYSLKTKTPLSRPTSASAQAGR